MPAGIPTSEGMSPSRRAFLRRSLAATGVLASASPALASAPPAPPSPTPSHRPPHQALQVEGVHGYADRESAAPGEEVAFHLSLDEPVEATLVRLGVGVDDPATDEVCHDFGRLQVRPQPIHPGSYVRVERGLQGEVNAFGVEAWVRPWRVDRLMGVVSQEDKESSEGWALGVGKEGYVGFYLGDGVSEDEALVHRTPPGVVRPGRWHHLVANWDGRTKEVWVDGRRLGAWLFAGPLRPGAHPIRLGAMGERGVTTRFLDGDLAMVVLRDGPLPEPSITSRLAEAGLQPAAGRNVLACWGFAEERGARVADDSRHGRHGRIYNRGTWMIGGPSFEAGVPRFGGYEPAQDTRRGHGLRLLSDDLYDCGWQPVLRWRVPREARSGFYALRLRWWRDGQAFYHHVMMVVRRSARRRPAPVLVLAATNTWRAYNAAPFGKPVPGFRQVCGTDGFPNRAGDPPAFSFYRAHASGPGSYQVGRRMPWPAADPYLRYGDATDYSHLARADRFAQSWLEREGYDYEMLSDHDLHRDPGCLRRHRVLVINGHSEYWSIPMYRGLEEYLGAGGRLVVLSGNSLFWRVSFDPAGEVMECRKVDAPGHQMRPEQRGEAWHSHDGRKGGLLRECGFPGWRLTGLETLGWNQQGQPRNFGPWVAEGVDHPVFHGPEDTGLRAGDRFGWAGEGRMPMANGHEFDVRLSTLAALASGPALPGAGPSPVDPPGLHRLANGIIPWSMGGSAFDYAFRPARSPGEQGGEMIWWDRPEGGRVFNAGTIGAGWALHADSRWAALLRNVLHAFGVPRPRHRRG